MALFPSEEDVGYDRRAARTSGRRRLYPREEPRRRAWGKGKCDDRHPSAWKSDYLGGDESTRSTRIGGCQESNSSVIWSYPPDGSEFFVINKDTRGLREVTRTACCQWRLLSKSNIIPFRDMIGNFKGRQHIGVGYDDLPGATSHRLMSSQGQYRFQFELIETYTSGFKPEMSFTFFSFLGIYLGSEGLDYRVMVTTNLDIQEDDHALTTTFLWDTDRGPHVCSSYSLESREMYGCHRSANESVKLNRRDDIWGPSETA
ncbi:hypothetical protein B0H14DRAFT_2598877 [Mycena olivaceomarginata]|nr:hypothetical protein B0H14DRAFT_2598877 [Mycena olivaceomarginata]